jgi:hypothetical protein
VTQKVFLPDKSLFAAGPTSVEAPSRTKATWSSNSPKKINDSFSNRLDRFIYIILKLSTVNKNDRWIDKIPWHDGALLGRRISGLLLLLVDRRWCGSWSVGANTWQRCLTSEASEKRISTKFKKKSFTLHYAIDVKSFFCRSRTVPRQICAWEQSQKWSSYFPWELSNFFTYFKCNKAVFHKLFKAIIEHRCFFYKKGVRTL